MVSDEQSDVFEANYFNKKYQKNSLFFFFFFWVLWKFAIGQHII